MKQVLDMKMSSLNITEFGLDSIVLVTIGSWIYSGWLNIYEYSTALSYRGVAI
jgi:hypothetical protein